jgi:hypothetical protein
VLEVERLRAEAVLDRTAIARELSKRQVPTPSGAGLWSHITVARVIPKAAGLRRGHVQL